MIALFAQVVFAQDAATGFSAQNYRPPVDARTSLWTERTTSYADPTFLGELLGSYTGDPLQYKYLDDTTETLISDVWEADLAAGVHYGRFRLGALVPLYLSSDGPAVVSGAGLGDLAADLKINLLRDAATNGDSPLGLAVSGRLIFPSATIDAPLGNRNTAWEAMALVDKQISHVVLAANVGVRGAPAVSLDNIELDDQLFYRGAVSYLFDGTTRSGLSADIAGQANLKDLSSSAGAPIEGMIGAWACLGDRVTLRGGLGRGNDGIGSPNLRAVIGLAYNPAAQCEEKVVEAAPQLVIDARTEDGLPVPGVTSALAVGNVPQTGTDEIIAQVEPGTYAYSATAPGYVPVSANITLPPDVNEHRVVVTMVPAPITVTVRLTDNNGTPLTGEWTSDEVTWSPIATEAKLVMPAGTYLLHGRAEGYSGGEEKLVVAMDGENTATIELGVKAVERIDSIDLKEVVQFDTNSATIKPVSYPLLDEVARIMTRHPEITKIRIEGHTDSVGEAAYNQQLSLRRAASVLGYLQGAGVALDRMTSAGFGEERPIATNDTPDGRYKNRRVTVVIEERKD